AGHQRHVCPGEEAESEPVGVLVGGGADDGLRRLPQPGVDDVEAGVAQGAGDDLDAAVVAVEADLGEDDANRHDTAPHGVTFSGQSKNRSTTTRKPGRTSGKINS